MESKYFVSFQKFFCHLNRQRIEKELEIRQIKKKRHLIQMRLLERGKSFGFGRKL